jgi:CheY-like chemotaxis protein
MNPSPPTDTTPRILLVDHDKTQREMIEQMLQSEGFRTETASNRQEALESLRRTAADLVIMNMIMPGAEGIGTIIAIRSFAPAMRIIAMSGGVVEGPQDFLPLAKSLGATALLSGPLDRGKVTDAVREVLAPGLRQMAS